MRASGILLHISSLPSDYGVGTLGKEAYKFVDFLHDAKQSYWQILPVGPTSYGDSPYQSFSTQAGNPYFIDLDILREDGLLDKQDFLKTFWGSDKRCVDYSNLYNKRFAVLRKAFENFKKTDMTSFYDFLEKNDNWISNYGLFMSIKNYFKGEPWLKWDDDLKKRNPHSLWEFKSEHDDDVMFWEFLQFKFFEQWFKLKEYANSKNIQIIGDIPIYVSSDSADVWVYPDLFDLNSDLIPNTVAGCPPDAFSQTGQLWGNPIYNWERHKETNYNWWIDRLKSSLSLFDIVRIDHFRGFDEYYTIPYEDKTAQNGQWKQGPGSDFFDFIKNKINNPRIIAEDLGFLTPSVIDMLEKSGFPGMKVLEFAFSPDGSSCYLPHNYDKNCVVYIGTHDNDTLSGWIESVDSKTLDFCKKYLRIHSKEKSEILWDIISAAFSCVGDTVIIQMQDYLELGSEARMNTPSTTTGNWCWRALKRDFTKKLALKIADITATYGRILK